MNGDKDLKNRWITPKAYESTGPSWAWLVVVLGLFGIFQAGRMVKPQAATLVSQSALDTRWEQMSANITGLIQGYDGEVGLYIKDLKSGRTLEYNPSRKFPCASLIKLPIMAATFDAINSGRLSLNTRLTYNKRYRREGSGTLKWAKTGARYPISYLIYSMITRSDNTATAMIIDKLGYDYLNSKFEQFGMDVLRIVPTGMSLSSRIDPSMDNYTTPREMGNLLEKIYRHQIVTDGLSDLMMEIMKGANAKTRLARYLPQDWKFARKTGLLRKNCHDVGIVFTPEGDYIICVLTGQNKNYDSAKGLIASVGRQTYRYIAPAS